MAVVMSWADLLNSASRFVILKETLKKSMESQVHANQLCRVDMISLSKAHYTSAMATRK
jgi:hypothetical protein